MFVCAGSVFRGKTKKKRKKEKIKHPRKSIRREKAESSGNKRN